MWKYPWFLNYKCEHEKHAVDNCLRQDYKIRMMVIKKISMIDGLVDWLIDWLFDSLIDVCRSGSGNADCGSVRKRLPLLRPPKRSTINCKGCP